MIQKKVRLKILGNFLYFIMLELIIFIVTIVLTSIFFIAIPVLWKYAVPYSFAFNQFHQNIYLFYTLWAIPTLFCIYYGWTLSRKFAYVLGEFDFNFTLDKWLGPIYFLYIWFRAFHWFITFELQNEWEVINHQFQTKALA